MKSAATSIESYNGNRVELVTTEQAAAFLDVTKSRFAHMDIRPVAKEGRRNLYDPRQVRRLAFDTAKNRNDEKPKDLEANRIQLELADERRRLTAAQADAQEEKNRMMRHEIAPFGFVTFALASLANALAAHLDSVPTVLIRQAGISAKDAEKVRAAGAGVANQIASLGDEEWVTERFAEYLEQGN